MADRPRTDIHTRLELTPRARLRRRVLRSSVALLLVAGAIGAAAAASRSMRTEPTTLYQTEPVHRGRLTVKVTATGELESLTQVKVGTEISGVVESVKVSFNDHVEVGQVLAKVNTDKLEAQRRPSALNLLQPGEEALVLNASHTFEAKPDDHDQETDKPLPFHLEQLY